MTFRSVTLGILLGLFVSAFTYFNDHIIQQTYFVGNFLPISVFGFLVLLVFLGSPLARLFGSRKGFAAAEVAVVIALGIAVCGWPGASFLRFFTAVSTVPANMAKVNSSWKATGVMNYTPGISGKMSQGHIKDWDKLATILVAGETKGESPEKRIWNRLALDVQSTLKELASGKRRFASADRFALLTALNGVLEDPGLYAPESFAGVDLPGELVEELDAPGFADADEREIVKTNRAVLVATFPDIIVPAPKGSGVLLADGDLESPAIQSLLQGKEGKATIGIDDIPWRTWWPTLRLWIGLAALVGIASVCMVLIFLPQWRRELLPFPIARFVQDIAQLDESGKTPLILKNKLFWYAFGFLVIVHLINGLHAWFPNFIEIPLQFDFNALRQLFPNARKCGAAVPTIFSPRLYPTVIAFAIFISAEASFSLGISGWLFVAFFSLLGANGIALKTEQLGASNASLLRFGSFFGGAIMILFVGRRYYFNVVYSMFGGKRSTDTPVSATVSAWILLLSSAIAVYLLSQIGVHWTLGTILLSVIYMMFAVLTRINSETGAFFLQTFWGPIGILTALFGVQAIGPTAYISMALVCTMFALDPREIAMPFIANGMHLLTNANQSTPKPSKSLLLGGMVLVGLFVALVATLYYQYNFGINHWDKWANVNMPRFAFDALSKHLSALSAYGELTASVTSQGLERLALIRPDWELLGWAGLGLSFFVGCSLLRLRFSWWPLHPVAFLVWGTWASTMFVPSFLLGWLVKVAITKMSGAKGFRMIKPLLMGVIAGELFAGLGWIIVGVIYYAVTNIVPHSYRIFPS